jgi:hypothetical protein
MIKIIKDSTNGQFGTASFSMDEQSHETEGQLMFRIVGQKLEVLDPFGGQNKHAYDVLSSLLEFELRQKGHLR